MFGICCLFCHAPSAGHTAVLLLFALILPSDLLHNFGWEIYRDQGCPKMTGVLFGPGEIWGGGVLLVMTGLVMSLTRHWLSCQQWHDIRRK